MPAKRPGREAGTEITAADAPARRDQPIVERVCPVCGGPLTDERCKLVCRSATCVYRIVYSCAEF